MRKARAQRIIRAQICDHSQLCFSPSRKAQEEGYSTVPPQQRAAAATTHVLRTTGMNVGDGAIESPASFPAPLVLPDDYLLDDLDDHTSDEPQSLRSWIREIDRNRLTPIRRTVYLAVAPEVDDDVEFLHAWVQPPKSCSESPDAKITKLRAQDILSYLEAFYHGLPVKLLSSPTLCFTSWVEDSTTESRTSASSSKNRFVGLKTSSECIRIRTRTTIHGDYKGQMNLDDLLDTAISILPEDAYALLLLVDHDLYEDDEDLFVCGRAYGGSRVAVISTARYNPILDRRQGLDRQHAWPASHCEKYMQSFYVGPMLVSSGKKRPLPTNVESAQGCYDLATSSSAGEMLVAPLPAAVSVLADLPSLEPPLSGATLSDLWLSRVCRTASHELGHCFGMDHCMYYACVMQGSASIKEDMRQPPYLCPVDLAKVLMATGTDAKERYQALLLFCDQHKETHMFAAFGAWIRSRLEEMDAPARMIY